MILDVRDGSRIEIEEDISYSSIDMSRGDRWLAYATCASGPSGCGESAIQLVDLGSGASRRVATLSGSAIVLALSPAADRLFVCLRTGSEEPELASLIVATSGRAISIEGAWWPLGWLGNQRVVLTGPWGSGDTLAVADAETGALRQFYP